MTSKQEVFIFFLHVFLKDIADTVGYWNYAEKADEVRFAPHPSIWGILPRDIARLSAYTSEMYF